VINHLSAGRVPQGATVERAVPTPLAQGEFAAARPDAADFATARDVARAINAAKGDGTALALDGRVVRVRAPARSTRAWPSSPTSRTCRSSWPSRPRASCSTPRTGSVVMNEAVTLAPCAVAHGSLSVTISSTPVISQPSPSRPARRWQARSRHLHHAAGGSIVQMPAGAQLADVVKALNSLGATPQDLLAILQAMKSGVALAMPRLECHLKERSPPQRHASSRPTARSRRGDDDSRR
jgi:flagellar P-ring protein precursor FlgI